MEQRWGNATEAGPKDNHDCHGVFTFGKVVVALVCDGMGGNQGGTHASALAVRTVHDVLKELIGNGTSPRDALVESIKRANTAIFDASRRNHRLAGMGTTIAAVAITNDVAHIAHVGDSRVYMVKGGTAKSLTRDHTMVNLFVEAELLSPEDAASHPEAHVLSRSLGVERTVEVEVQAPLTLEYADTLVLTSDGAHTVINEGDLANIDWSDPGEAAQTAIRLLGARRGEDNGTIVGIITGEFDGEPSAETAPPVLEDISDPMSSFEPEAPRGQPPAPRPPTPAAGGFSEAPSFMDIPRTPPPAPQREAQLPAAKNGDVVDIPPEPAALPVRPSLPPPPPQVPQPPIKHDRLGQKQPDHKPETKPAEAKKKPEPKSKLPLILAGVAGLVGLLTLGGIVLAFKLSQGPASGEVPVVVGDPVASIDPATPAVTPTPVGTTDPAVPPIATTPVEAAPPAVPLFAPEALPDVKNPSHHAVKYLNPPPGGSEQFEAISAAKETKDCEHSLDVVAIAIKKSVDYATLYTHPWKCFNDEHQKPLLNTKATDLTSFKYLLPHFQGEPPVDPTAAPTETPAKPGPNSWAEDAFGGIEYRMEKFHLSGDKDRLADVVLDKYGSKVVADQLMRDMWVEANAARGLSALEAQDEETVQWWARRVYVTQRYWAGPIGALIRRERPDVAPKIEAMMKESVKAIDPRLLEKPIAKGEFPPLPQAVWEAYGAGRGVMLLPNNRKPVAPPKEIVIHRFEPDEPPPPEKIEKIKIH